MPGRLPTSAEDAHLVDLGHRLRAAGAEATPEGVRKWLAGQPRFRGAPAEELDLWAFWLHDLIEAWTMTPEPFEGDRYLAGTLAVRFEAQWSKDWYAEEPARKALEGLERDFDKLADWLPAQPELAGLGDRELLWYRRAVRARTLRDIS